MNIERIAKYKVELSEQEVIDLNNALGRIMNLVSEHMPQAEYAEIVNNRTVDKVVGFRTLLYNGLGG